jgi:hypothetical protein
MSSEPDGSSSLAASPSEEGVPRPPTVVLTPENVEQLKRFPHPPDDNGIGLHFHLDLRDEFIATTVEHLKSIRATWTMIYAQDELQARRAATACWREGIMPVVRIGKRVDENFDPVPYVQALLAIGAPPYVQVYNEPEDAREYKDARKPNDWLGMFARNWVRQASRVVAAGGMPGLQVLERVSFDAAVDAVNASGGQEIWKHAFFVQHNYAENHPPAYPYDERNQRDKPGQTIVQDHLGTLSFLAYAAWMQERIGFVMPIIGGEGGWLFGAEKDLRYPKVESALHAQYHKEMFEWLRTGLLSNGEPLPDYLFSITPWIAGSFTFAGQNWWGNILRPDGKLTATIEAVQSIPPFVRRFSWDTGQQPEPQPPPPPPPGGLPDAAALEAIQRGAWAGLRISFNPEAILASYARAHNLGAPLTEEFDAAGFRCQGFVGGIAYMPTGQPDKVNHAAW